MAGTRTNANPVRGTIEAYSSAAVTALQVLKKWTANFPCRVLAVKANAGTAGAGTGSTILTVTKNGVAIWTTAANRPTLPVASTGEFTNTNPDVRAILPGDVISLEVVSIPTVTGHADLAFSVSVGLPA